MIYRVILTLLAVSLSGSFSRAQQTAAGAWQFAVSGDSRNCGDVVMPAIAQSVLKYDVKFYWHLGDFRLMSGVDEDMQVRYKGRLTLEDYSGDAWGDFLANQIAPFGLLPIHLGIGNHELYGNKTTQAYVTQFAYWLDTPELRTQRLNDFSQDTSLKPYYHWQQGGIEFIYMDNSTDDGFGEAQVGWLERILQRDKSDHAITAVVIGMHRALPNSFACGHSMNGDLRDPITDPDYANDIKRDQMSTESGRRAYSDLAQWRRETNKFVYILASHSHFFMESVFATDYWKDPQHGGMVLPGWIVGTAGAKRYALPKELSPAVVAQTKASAYVYGYLLATVHPGGMVDFKFKDVTESEVPAEVMARYGTDLDGKNFVHWCFADNRDERVHPPPPSCRER